jgi:hypothetical protein
MYIGGVFMLKTISNMLTLKNVKMFKNDSNKDYVIELEYKDSKDAVIKHTFEYHYYDNAINDLLVLTKSIKGGR